MSGISVRDLITADVIDRVYIYVPGYENEHELDWSVIYDDVHGWLLGVQDDGGDIRYWKVMLEELGEEP